MSKHQLEKSFSLWKIGSMLQFLLFKTLSADETKEE